MTVANVSPRHQHAVSAGIKGLEDKVGIDPAGTHHPDNPHIGRILKAAYPCQVSSGIGAPVAGKRNNLRFKSFGHNKTPVSNEERRLTIEESWKRFAIRIIAGAQRHQQIVNHQSSTVN
jgi:hypothetical protein